MCKCDAVQAAIGLSAIGFAEIGLAPRSSENRSAVCRAATQPPLCVAVCGSMSTRQARADVVSLSGKEPFTSQSTEFDRQSTPPIDQPTQFAGQRRRQRKLKKKQSD